MQFGSSTTCIMHLSQRGFQFICELEEISDPDKTFALRRSLRALEDLLNRRLTAPVTQHQFDALVSLGKSIGVEQLLDSMVLAHVNKKRYESAADLIRRWNRINGQESALLKARREQERLLFLGELNVDR